MTLASLLDGHRQVTFFGGPASGTVALCHAARALGRSNVIHEATSLDYGHFPDLFATTFHDWHAVGQRYHLIRSPLEHVHSLACLLARASDHLPKRLKRAVNLVADLPPEHGPFQGPIKADPADYLEFALRYVCTLHSTAFTMDIEPVRLESLDIPRAGRSHADLYTDYARRPTLGRLLGINAQDAQFLANVCLAFDYPLWEVNHEQVQPAPGRSPADPRPAA